MAHSCNNKRPLWFTRLETRSNSNQRDNETATSWRWWTVWLPSCWRSWSLSSWVGPARAPALGEPSLSARGLSSRRSCWGCRLLSAPRRTSWPWNRATCYTPSPQPLCTRGSLSSRWETRCSAVQFLFRRMKRDQRLRGATCTVQHERLIHL